MIKVDVVLSKIARNSAHQYADEVFGGQNERPHGPLFNRACYLLRANPTASDNFKPLDKRISSEIYWNLKDQAGTIYKRALKAVALLGGDTPAVGSLGDVQALYTKRYIDEIDAEVKVLEYSTKGVNAMDEKEIIKAKATIRELQSDLEVRTAEFEKLKQEKEELEKKYSEFEFGVRKKDIMAKVDSLIDNKKVLPAQREYMIEALSKESELKSYSDEGSSIDDHPLIKMFEEGADVVDTEEKSEENADEVKKDEDVEEAAKAEAIEKANSYQEAAKIYMEGVNNNA